MAGDAIEAFVHGGDSIDRRVGALLVADFFAQVRGLVTGGEKG